MKIFNQLQISKLVAWASREAERQSVGPEGVSNLIDAFLIALNARELTPSLIELLGMTVEPEKVTGFRKSAVVVGSSTPPAWQEVPRLIDQLTEGSTIVALTPTEWYREFEEIHPFADGNGRVGAILFNWLSGTMHPDEVLDAPDLWGAA